jgi:HprK-related kinase A
VQANDIYLRTGPFITHLAAPNELLRRGIDLLYDPVCLLDPPPIFSDFHVAVRHPPLRGWWRPKIVFQFDGEPIFTPSPTAHSLQLFEWGLNWVIARTAHQYLIIHAAVAERGGRALIMPGLPGSGKSTLCTGLVHRGWRLLSDELALIVPATRELVGVPRPISLKNESIAVIRNFAPDAVLSDPVDGTAKGTIALARPPGDSMRRAEEPAQAGWIVFPSYEAGAASRLGRRPKAECFIEIAANSINYSVLGELGFTVLADIVDRCQCFDFTYSDLADGVRLLTELADAA